MLTHVNTYMDFRNFIKEAFEDNSHNVISVRNIRQILDKHIDPKINNRRYDYKTPSGFSGTINYAAPEQINAYVKNAYENNEDQVEIALNAIMKHFAWFYQKASIAHSHYLKFKLAIVPRPRIFEHINPVIYQSLLMTIKNIAMDLGSINYEVSQMTPTRDYSKIMTHWSQFYKIWQEIIPEVQGDAESFEKNSRDHFNQHHWNNESR